MYTQSHSYARSTHVHSVILICQEYACTLKSRSYARNTHVHSVELIRFHVGFEVLTPVTNTVFWDVATFRRNEHPNCSSLFATVKHFSSLAYFFYPEDGGDTFLRTVGL
jgi:hypothetical protein